MAPVFFLTFIVMIKFSFFTEGKELLRNGKFIFTLGCFAMEGR